VLEGWPLQCSVSVVVDSAVVQAKRCCLCPGQNPHVHTGWVTGRSLVPNVLLSSAEAPEPPYFMSQTGCWWPLCTPGRRCGFGCPEISAPARLGVGGPGSELLISENHIKLQIVLRTEAMEIGDPGLFVVGIISYQVNALRVLRQSR
jgi:hypothetical protein